MFRRLKSLLQQNFLWRLTILNVILIAAVIILSSWAIYHTACFLVEGMGDVEQQRQQQFNSTLFNYLIIFSISGIVVGSLLHIYMTRKIVAPIRQMIDSIEQFKRGTYPEPIEVRTTNELGELIEQYNKMITQLESHESHRNKLVTDLSHEIRTPLANLQGYLHGLKSGVIQADATIYASLLKETERLTKMTEQIDQLNESNNQIPDMESIPESLALDDEIRQCISMFDWTLKDKKISIIPRIEPVELVVNRENIQRVLTNLLDNAIRYYKGTQPIYIIGSKRSNYYKVSIKGPSKEIPSVAEQQLFDRFYRVDSSRSRSSGGTGLGLAIVKEIIEQQGGSAGFHRAEDLNTFWFTLPL